MKWSRLSETGNKRNDTTIVSTGLSGAYIASCKIYVDAIVTAAGLLKENAALTANDPKRLPRNRDVEIDDGYCIKVHLSVGID